MLKIPRGMGDTGKQNLAAFLAFFLPASLLFVWAATRAENFFWMNRE
jgi:hypothetical protein